MKTILFLFALCLTATSQAAFLKLKKIGMDGTKLKISLDTMSFTDDGPIVACLVNRLIKAKYRYYLEYKGPGPIERTDLELFKRVARYLPEEERAVLSGAVAAYMRDESHSRATDVFEALVAGIRSGLKDHVSVHATWTFEKDDTAKRKQAEVSLLTKKIDALAELNEGQVSIDPLESEQINRWRRRRSELEEKIRNAPISQNFDIKANYTPVNDDFCVGNENSTERTSLSNSPEEIAEFLTQTRALLDALDKASAGNTRTGRSGTHR